VLKINAKLMPSKAFVHVRAGDGQTDLKGENMSETPNGLLPVGFERWFSTRCKALTTLLAKTGIKPNQITLLSLVLGFLAGVLLALGHMGLAFVSGFFMGVFDILDGQLASSTKQTTPYGGILDSTIDRYNEFFLYMGLGIYFYQIEQPIWTLICVLVLVGSILVSYVKARAEGALIDCPVGFLQRSERLVLLAVGILVQGWILKVILAFMAVMTHVTVIQRLIYVKDRETIRSADPEFLAQQDMDIKL
jgi:CDP-diacylglycerol--glycerol-3-phosphate 3-phosphatidyltransferase